MNERTVPTFGTDGEGGWNSRQGKSRIFLNKYGKRAGPSYSLEPVIVGWSVMVEVAMPDSDSDCDCDPDNEGKTKLADRVFV